jgi:uncharacterized protein YecT (DUF1311 family)
MKLAISIAIALFGCGTAWAQAGFSGQVMNSNWGVTIWFESKLEPPTPDIKVEGASGIKSLENARPGMRRYTVNERTHEYFGYDMNVDPLDRVAGTFRVSFTPLLADPKDLGLKDPAGWHQTPPPSFPSPQTLNISDTIAVDLFEDPGSHQKIVDYIHFRRDNCDSDDASPGQIACLNGKLQDARQLLANQLSQTEASQDSATVSRVTDSQRAWETYLQATCSQIGSEIDRLQCELRLTRGRLRDLASSSTLEQK